MFYSTDISVTLWILNNNKKARTVEQNGKMVRYRNRENDTKMKQLQADMRDLLQQEEESKQELKALFKKLGYNLY